MAIRVVGYDDRTGQMCELGAAADQMVNLATPMNMVNQAAALPTPQQQQALQRCQPQARRPLRFMAPQLPAVEWRDARQANGVYEAQENMVPLPFIPDTNGGVFVPGGAAMITWIGKPQRPCRAERLLVNVAPVVISTPGLAGTRALALGPFVGADFQPTARGNIDLGFYTSQAFGVRFALTAAEPGIEIAFPVTLSVYPAADGESVFISLQMNVANIA